MKKLFYIFLFLLLAGVAWSQSSDFLFYSTRVKDGLSFNVGFSLLRDSRGVMWIGTLKGLNRYDGSHVTQFNAGEDSNSFINNTILDLCEDRENNIWGATGSGIFCYKTRENKFANYIPPGYDYARAVHNVICDKQGDIWATGLWTILKLNKQSNKFDEIGPLTPVKDSLGFYSVRQNGMIEDPSGKGFWLATRMGMHYYNKAENKFYSYKNMPNEPLFASQNVSALSLSRFGYGWFFSNTTREAIAFDPATYKILHRVKLNGIIDGAIGQTLFEDSNHKLWFSTWNLKMVVIDYRKGTHTYLDNSSDNPLSIPGDNFWDIWEDEDQTLWLATGGGLARCNYSKSLYSIYRVSDKVKEFNQGRLGALKVDPRDSSWWIASESQVSVIHYYPETGKYVFFDFAKAAKNKLGQLPGPVYHIDFLEGRPFVNTHTGVWELNENTTAIVPHKNRYTLINEPAVFLQKTGDHLWYTTAKGYIRYNTITGEEKLIKSSIETLPDSQQVKYSNLFFDREGRPWVVPAFGWLGYINNKDEIVLDFYVKDKPRELAAYLVSLQTDSKNTLWMASIGAGLYRYDIATHNMKLLSLAEGIETTPRDMIIDKQDRIWMVSFDKFSVYDPATGRISIYHLPVYESTTNYMNKFTLAANGEILVTLHKDIIKFIPDRVNQKPGLKAPLISAITISGEEKLITDETSFYLQPDQNSLEFHFGSLISDEIFPYTLMYKLDGADEDWLEAQQSSKALYSNLEPGKYLFRVKAIAKNGSWETLERTLTIKIKTPFYKAGWFWLLIGSFIIGSLIFLYRFRLNKQRQILTLETKAQQLEKEKTVVMYDNLKQQLNPHFLFNSLTSLSGLIETDQVMAGTFLEQMSGIYRYILKNGDNETVTLKDEIEFVKLYINLQQTRFKKGLQVDLEVPEEYLHLKIAPVTLQNLIENAIKHNIIDTGSPLVIRIFVEEDYLVVKNNLQLKHSVETSNKKGLAQFRTLYNYLSDKPVQIEQTQDNFFVRIPLI